MTSLIGLNKSAENLLSSCFAGHVFKPHQPAGFRLITQTPDDSAVFPAGEKTGRETQETLRNHQLLLDRSVKITTVCKKTCGSVFNNTQHS